jgi:hypothetical protein
MISLLLLSLMNQTSELIVILPYLNTLSQCLKLNPKRKQA